MRLNCELIRNTKLKVFLSYAFMFGVVVYLLSRHTKKVNIRKLPVKKEISEYDLWHGCLNDAIKLTSKSRFHPTATEMLPPLSEDIPIMIPLPFIALAPGGFNTIRSRLERLFIFCSSPVQLYILTDENSFTMVDSILEMINFTANCPFKAHKIEIDDFASALHDIVKRFNVPNNFTDIVMSFIPLLLPYYLKEKRIIYHNLDIIYRGDILNLYDLFFGFDDKVMIAAANTIIKLNDGVIFNVDSPKAEIRLIDTNLFLLDLEKLRKFEVIKTEMQSENFAEAIKLYGQKMTLANWLSYFVDKYPSYYTDINCKAEKFNFQNVSDHHYVCDKFNNLVVKWNKEL